MGAVSQIFLWYQVPRDLAHPSEARMVKSRTDSQVRDEKQYQTSVFLEEAKLGAPPYLREPLHGW